MPSLKDIKRRIGSVQKTQQITSAMRMVAAAKLRRAEQAIKKARPYAERMRQTVAEVAAAGTDVEHPLLAARNEIHNVELVVLTSDRGLAGAFNAGAAKRADAWIAERRHGIDALSITAIGRKGADHVRRRHASALREAIEVGTGWVEYEWAAAIGRKLAARYASGEVDQVVLVYNEFKTVMTQTPVAVQLLPFATPEQAEGAGAALPYEFEPNAEKLLTTLVPRAIEVEVFRAALENQAGEHAARMTAMESATRNTKDLIESLTLQYNRARQAAITKELVEIVSGAQALD
ncbi:MAG: ATP synthase F1 subunit gamma [Myxococcota bacterium]|nr:ATP synthase F1 subunit gamma [Myxococcales bacterium]